MGILSRRVAGGLAFAAVALGAVAAQAADAPSLFIQADMVRGVQKEMTGAPCVLNSQFKHKEEVVWRIRVIDAKTGEPLDAAGLKGVDLVLSSGETLPAHFGGHPPPKPVDTFWTVAWVVPDTYPTGSFSYHITATGKDGGTATFEPFKTKPSLPTIVADSGAK
jgi:hypothetical protein